VTDLYIHLHDAAESIRELPAKNLSDPDTARTMRWSTGEIPLRTDRAVLVLEPVSSSH
jgi:hypothetical protein